MLSRVLLDSSIIQILCVENLHEQAMDELLKTWGLDEPELMKSLEDNAIDLEALALLEEEDIKTLIPKIGLRRKFTRKWQERFKPSPLPCPAGGIPIGVIDGRFPDSLPTLFMSDAETDSMTADSMESELEEVKQTNTPGATASCSSSSTWVPPLKRRNALVFDVRKILSETDAGRNVARALDANGFLTKKERHTLVSLLVGNLITQHGPNPGAYEKSLLAESLCKSFPALEDPDGITGYEAYYMKGARGRPATGYLEEHLRYVRKKMREKERVLPSKDSQKKESDTDSAEADVTADLQEKVDWMKKNTEPQIALKQYMADTFEVRKRWINDEDHSLSDILREFPRILDPAMLKQDFELLYPTLAEKFTQGWSTYAQSVIQYACSMFPMWKALVGIDTDTECLTKDERDNLALFLLPIVFGNRSKAKAGGRASFADAISSFIETKPENTHMPSYLDSISSTATPQPFILCLYADQKLEPSQVFVIIERSAVTVETLVAAVDLCYKSYYVLNLEYQHKCRGVWEFIETCVFEHPGAKGKLSSAVRAFRAYIKNVVKL